MPPLMTPQTGPAKRGPKMATAAQGNYLANQAARRPTVTPTTPPGKPNPFSASGPGTTPSPSTGGGMSASGVSSIPAASAPGASASPSSLGTVPMASATMKRGGSVKRYAAGGTTETNQYGSWGGANAANAVAGASAPTYSGSNYTAPTPAAGPFSTTPGQSPLGGSTSAASTPAAPNYYAGMVAGNGDNPQYNINQGGYLMGSAPGGAESGEVGGSFYTARGGSIPAPKEEPYRNKWKAKNHPGDSSYKFDTGGDVPDPGGVDMSQGQEGQAGDLNSALGQVQQAYQYGLQQVAGNIPTVPAGPGGDQTQGGGPQDRGQQMAASDQRPIPPAPGGQPPQGVLQPTPKPFNPRDFLPGQQQSDAGQYTASVARGGSVPSFDDGGSVSSSNSGRKLKELPRKPFSESVGPLPITPPTSSPGNTLPLQSYQMGGPAVSPAAPQPQQPTPAPTGGGVGGSQPPQLMRYLSGADAAPVQHVLQRHKTMDPSLPGTARTIHNIAGAGDPQQQYQTLQAYRRLSDNAATHAKVSLTGNGKQPASLPHAVMFANKKFEYQPTPYHVSFALKGKGKPTNKAARGGVIQSFDDGGDVGPDQSPDPISQMAGAGAPITMNVSDLQTGQTQSQDITPAQLQSLASGSFDSYVAHPTETLSQAVERAQANAEAGGVNEPIQQSQGSVGQRIGNFIPSAIKNAGQSNQANAPGEADISGTIEPDWSQVKRTGLAPGPEATTGDQGAAAAGTSPGQPAPGEGPMSPFNLPVANKDRTAVPVGKVTSSALPPATEPINNTRDIPGTEIDKNGVRRVTDPQAYDDFRNGRTNFDFNTTPSEQGAQPYSSQVGTPQTELNQESAPSNGATPTVNRFGIGQESAPQAADIARRGGEAARLSAEQSRAAEPRQATPSGQSGQRAPAARARQARGRPARGRIPRRVYGPGHAGLGTYQELADGTAQYLGPQNLTG